MRTMIFLTVLLPAFALSGPITYQGQLQDTAGPVSETVEIDFELYESVSGGTPLATDGPHTVTVTDGLFQIELDFGQNAFDGEERWLQLIVQGIELSPRQRINPAPIAHFALAGNEGPQGPAGPAGAFDVVEAETDKVLGMLVGYSFTDDFVSWINSDGELQGQRLGRFDGIATILWKDEMCAEQAFVEQAAADPYSIVAPQESGPLFMLAEELDTTTETLAVETEGACVFQTMTVPKWEAIPIDEPDVLLDIVERE